MMVCTKQKLQRPCTDCIVCAKLVRGNQHLPGMPGEGGAWKLVAAMCPGEETWHRFLATYGG